MAISLRCTKCKTNHRLNQKKCIRCNSHLGSKYQVRVKDPNSGRIKSKMVDSLSLAKKVEAKFKVQMLEGDLFNQRKPNKFRFDKYLDYAKQHKKSWKDDQSR